MIKVIYLDKYFVLFTIKVTYLIIRAIYPDKEVKGIYHYNKGEFTTGEKEFTTVKENLLQVKGNSLQ